MLLNNFFHTSSLFGLKKILETVNNHLRHNKDADRDI